MTPLDAAAIVAAAAPLAACGDPRDSPALLELLRLLYAIGRRDLPLGRLVEGHVDAVQIVSRYGDAAQRAAVRAAGVASGVWNADLPVEPLVLAHGRLTGGKAFASGAGILSHALVSVDAEGGRQLVLLDLAAAPPAIDRSWWRVTGMQRSETHLVRWHDHPLPPNALVGRPDDYVREPWFGGGAIRFAAVQAGGIAALVDRTRDHLAAHGRSGDPHQRGRLADLHRAAQSAADAIARAAHGWQVDDVAGTLARVAAARVAVYAAGEAALTLAAAAVGVQAMFVEHPLAAIMSDLTVYLRQPAPDLQRDRVGEAVANGLLAPEL